MTAWEITYTADKQNYHTEAIDAKTYTMAIIEFMRKFPKAEYIEVKELIK